MTPQKLVSTLVCLALVGCSGHNPESGKKKDKETPPPVVGVTRPRQETRGQTREYTGSLESANQVAVVPQIAGQLESVTVSVGDSVRQGQLLATVEDSQLEAQVSQARASAEAAQAAVQTAMANLAAARDVVLASQQAIGQTEAQVLQVEAVVSKAEIQLRLAESDLKRIRVVAQKDLVAPQVVDQAAAKAEEAAAELRSARAQLKSARTQLQQNKLRSATSVDQEKAAQSQVKSAQAQAASQASALQAAEVRRSYSLIKSPMDGVVIARPLDPGAYVAPASSNPVLVVASLKSMRVSFQLSEGDLSLVRPGQQLQVRFDALPKLVLNGEVQRIAGGLDPSTRTVRVEVRLSRPDTALRPGMLARLKLQGPARKALTLPLPAVITEAKKQYVWVIDEDKIAHKRPVEVDVLEGDVAFIRAGLSDKDSVVVRGVDQVQEDKPVQPTETQGKGG